MWKKRGGQNEKGSTRLSPESEAAYHAIGVHFHDLRHEGGSRLIEAGWPVHHVQHMLGHASLLQTNTYLNTTFHGLPESMRTRDEARKSCKAGVVFIGGTSQRTTVDLLSRRGLPSLPVRGAEGIIVARHLPRGFSSAVKV